jgi:ElaB/YqjD/DUF883 family membrane-anchored ribosome-binding protein
MQHDSDHGVDEILSRIEGTRREMDRTLSAIERKFSRERLLDQGLDYLRDSGAAEFAQNLGGAARQNPLPVVLTGIGLAWLMALGRTPAEDHGRDSRSLEFDATGDGDGLGDGFDDIKERAGDKFRSMRQRAGGAMHSMTDATRDRWDRARSGVEHLAHDRPLVLGAIGLAVGAALGASAPRTHREEQMLSRASRRMNEKAREAGSEQLDKAKEAVRRATEPERERPETH